MKVIKQNDNLSFQSVKFDVSKIPEINIIEAALFSVIADSQGLIHQMCSHILEAGGKRIRPLLVLHSGLAFSQVHDELLGAAVAAELIHMASLVHDDIIEVSDLRRS